jgi:hypothetical protein
MFEKAQASLSFFQKNANAPETVKQKANLLYSELDRLTSNLLGYKSQIYAFSERAIELENIKKNTGKFSRQDAEEMTALYEAMENINKALIEHKYLDQIENVNNIFNTIIAPYINKPEPSTTTLAN